MEETNYSRSIILAHENEPDTTVSPSSVSENGDEKDDEKKDAAETDVEPTEIPALSYGKQKTYLDKIKPFRTYDLKKPNHLIGMVTRPLIFLSFPVIFYAGFSYGSNLVWFNVLNGTASLVLAGSPYNFAASMVGVSYVSPLIGVAIGSLYTGYIGDRIVLKMARKNGGILEPEHRLWLFTPSLLLIPFGLILWGVGEHQMYRDYYGPLLTLYQAPRITSNGSAVSSRWVLSLSQTLLAFSFQSPTALTATKTSLARRW